MCGIAGIFYPDQRRVNEPLLKRMNASLLHRGPDEGDVHLEPGVGLAHRRLSIIDLSNGHQPLFNEDGTVAVVYNGEIYNFAELSKELQAAGHQFRTHCDTEVIVHAWEEWGAQCVQRFRGMFAFAIWDRNRRRLFLARDRLGIKPLYYAHLPDGGFAFASELKSLLLHPKINKALDAKAVENYFAFGYVPDPRTIIKGVHKLPPAHTLGISDSAPAGRIKRYWDLPFSPIANMSEADAAEGLVEHLREAVNMRLVADVPLGAFLSGGVDSSAVVALMAGLSSEAVNTCSISFGDPAYNESEYAARVAKQFACNHHVEQVDADDYDLIDTLAKVYDEPFADSSAIPTYRVCELARKRVTVALSGDGGDENLAGYRRYRWHMYEEMVRERLPGWLRAPVFGALGKIYPKADWAPKKFRAKTTFQAIARDSLAAYLHSVSVIPGPLRKQLFSKSFVKGLNGYSALEVFKDISEQAPTDDPLSLVQYLDFRTYLPGDILTKVDRASMAHSLEVRVPLLDHKVVEWISCLQPSLKLRNREGKYIFKKSMEPHLPKDILYRNKMGFAVPVAKWFKGPLRDRVRAAVLGEPLGDTGFFDRKMLRKILDQHESGMGEHSAALWSLLMFDAFLRNVLHDESSNENLLQGMA